MANPIRTGVVGFGLAGRVFHAPFIHAVPGLELAAIMQRSGDTAAQAYPQANIFRTFDSLLASDVELIAIGTPNDTHFPFAKAAIEAGKHVVVDKPVCATSAEAAELDALAKKQGVVYAPFHNRRFDGDFLTVSSILQSGELGRVVWFESHFDRFRPGHREHAWKENPGDLQSLAMDLGPHLVDQALALFGQPKSVTANFRIERETSLIEDAFEIRLDFGHLQAFLRSTLIAADPAPRFHIHGTQGSFRKLGVDPQEPAIVAGATVPQMSDGSWLLEDESMWGTLSLATTTGPQIATNAPQITTIEPRIVPTHRGDYRNFYLNVRDAILGQADLTVQPIDATRTLRIIELARQSSREGRTLPVQNADWNW